MAKLLPFTGLRYSLPFIKELPRLVVPPYDIISPADQERFYRLHRHNIIRLEFGRSSGADTPANNRYTRARKTLQEWMRKNVLRLEKNPAFYLLRTRYLNPLGESKTFTGLVARVKLEPFGEGKILPHEKTYQGPKTDRMSLLKETGLNISPVFSLYRDPSQRITGLLAKVAARKPLFRFDDWSGSTQELWLINRLDEIEAIQTGFLGKKMLIADGHHRYSTALEYQRLERERVGESADSVMMCLAETHDPGMTVLPVYRLIQGVGKDRWQQFWKQVPNYFEIEKISEAGKLDEFQRKASRGFRGAVLGFLGDKGKKALLLKLNNYELEPFLEPGGLKHSRIYCRLDVVLLNHLILSSMLGIRAGEENGRVRYTKDLAEARREVTSGGAQAAFLPGLPNLDTIWDLAKQGETMPQKSTYFLPKPVTGLVMNPVDLPQ